MVKKSVVLVGAVLALTAAIGPSGAQAQSRPVLSFLNVERDLTLFARQTGPLTVFCPGAYQFVSFGFGPIGQPGFDPRSAFAVRSIVPLQGGNGVTIDLANPGPLGPVTIRAVASCVLLGTVSGQPSAADAAVTSQRRKPRRRRPARPKVKTRVVRGRVRVGARRRARGSAVTTTRVAAMCERPNSTPSSFGFRSRRSQLVSVKAARSRGDRGFRAVFRTDGSDTLDVYAVCIEGVGPVRLGPGGGRAAGTDSQQIGIDVRFVTSRRSPDILRELGIHRFPVPPPGASAAVIPGMPPFPDRDGEKLVATGFQGVSAGQLEAVAAMQLGSQPNFTYSYITVRGAEVERRDIQQRIEQFIAALGPGLPGLGPLPPSTPAPPTAPTTPGDGTTPGSKQLTTTIVCPDNVDDAPTEYIFTFFIPLTALDVEHSFVTPSTGPLCPGTTGNFPGVLQDPAQPPPSVPPAPPGMKAVRVRVQVNPNPAGSDTTRDGPAQGVTVQVTWVNPAG